MSLFERMRSCKLRTKFVVAISLMLMLTLVVTSVYMIERLSEGYRRELETTGSTMIKILAINAESGVLFESQYELDELVSMLPNFESFTHATIYNTEGKSLSTIGSWDERNIVIKRALYPDAADSSHYQDYYIESSDGREFIEFNHPVVSRKETLSRETLGLTGGIDQSVARNYVTEDIGSIKLILSLEQVNHSIADARWTAFLMTSLVLVLAILVVALFVRVITRPVKMLVEVTDQVSRGDLSRRVDIRQHDEIGHLANTFNRMIDSLKQSRDEIEEYNRNLEHKIVERTIALEEAQKQLIQSEKMSAIGQLAAGVAHELNNPLGGILGYAQFAVEKIKKRRADLGDDKESEGYLRYLSYIETQARRCKNIVQNLLRFSRSSHTTEFERIDINEVVEDTRTFVEHQLHMNQITLKVDLGENLPQIEANAGQLQQVLTNLIINAMHASAPDSEIQAITRYCPAVGEFGGTVEVKIIDQGAGIPPEILNKIFEPFFTTKEVGKGTGLGLSLSYGIIREHGGEIRVDSTVGAGTTFTVILPVQKAAPDTDTITKRMLTP